MLARIRKSMEEKDQGFTLIELLVVMIIIGILAAIAIPVFLSQRQRAVEAGMKSDLRTLANEVETFFVDNQSYPAVGDVNVGTTGVVTINGVEIAVDDTATFVYELTNADGAFCLTNTNTAADGTFTYDSNDGGLLAKDVACDTA